MHEREYDELLESVWICRENRVVNAEEILKAAHVQCDPGILTEMAAAGLLRLEGQTVIFTPEGESRASDIIRRHRLAERLFVDVLGLPEEQIEGAACTFEHTILPEVTASLCTLLGHPRECPHGKSIPPGPDCLEGLRQVESILVPLTDLSVGRSARIAYLRPRQHDRLHLLLSMGIHSGVDIRVHQKTPMLVIEIGTAEFALDASVAEDIYVRICQGKS